MQNTRNNFAEHRHVFISACANKEANTIFNSTLNPVWEFDSVLWINVKICSYIFCIFQCFKFYLTRFNSFWRKVFPMILLQTGVSLQVILSNSGSLSHSLWKICVYLRISWPIYEWVVQLWCGEKFFDGYSSLKSWWCSIIRCFKYTVIPSVIEYESTMFIMLSNKSNKCQCKSSSGTRSPNIKGMFMTKHNVHAVHVLHSQY